MLSQGKSQWGNAVKSFWFDDGELCPGCRVRPVGTVKAKGKEGLPIDGLSIARAAC